MPNKSIGKILAILFVVTIGVSCTMPSIAGDNRSTNNASNRFADIFPSENITTNNTPFPLSSFSFKEESK